MNRINRYWNMSPADLTRAVKRRAGRLIGSPESSKASWHRIVAGPLAGAEFFLVLDAVSTWQDMIAGSHDAWLFEAAASRGPLDGKICWDIGGHIGFHALAFASLVGPTGKVLSFEPNPTNLARMEQNFSRNPALASRVSVRPLALSDRSGVAEFRFSNDVESGISSGSHLTTADAPSGEETYQSFGLTEVKTATIDELVASGEAPPPDVMKIDVEGAEAAVLRGGKDVIQRQRPVLLVEVHHILQMLEVCQLLIG
jgi:FkbM family methyltransferase